MRFQSKIAVFSFLPECLFLLAVLYSVLFVTVI